MKTYPVKVFPRVVIVFGFLLFGVAVASYGGGKVAAWGDNYYGQCILPNGLRNVKAISGGDAHSLALKADGTVVVWGYNYYGQANVLPGLSGVVGVSAGGYHSLALKVDGTVVAWGYNYYGQTNVPSGLPRIRAIAAGGYHSVALKADGTVSVWGNAFGNTNVPAGLSNVTAVAAGLYHTLALKADGTVVAWGHNSYGQTNVPPNLSNVVAVAAGFYHNLALRADGTVVAWGYGSYGQTNVPPDLSDVTAVAAGYYLNLALKADGSLVAWGGEAFGKTNLPPGIASVTAIACGGDHNLALVSEGPPQINDQPGNMGVEFQSNTVLSVVATGFEPLSYRWYFNNSSLIGSARISGVTNASLSISNAQFTDIGRYTVIVSNAFGSVQSSGAVITVISPPIITTQPVGQTVIAGTNISLSASAIGTPPLSYQWLLGGVPVAGANSSSVNLTNVQSSQSGIYSLLVSNAYGAVESSNALVTVLESPPYILTQPVSRSAVLGGVTTFEVNTRGSTPLHFQWRFNGVDISGANNATLTLTSLRYDQAGFYTVAISNSFGSIVSAKAELKVQQVAVWGSTPWPLIPTNVPPSLTNLVAIAAGDSFVLGLKSDGTVATWGSIIRTILVATNIPPGLSNVISIAAGSQYCLALRSNGTVVAWGGASGFFFPPPTTPSPTNVPVGLSNVVAIAAGSSHSLALKADGQVAGWGSTKFATVPAGLSNVVAIAAGGNQNLALKSDGRVVAWGYSTNVPNSLSNVIAVACADGCNLALQNNGKVVAWAAQPSPPSPLFPRGPAINTNVPSELSNVVAIAAGDFGMALKSDGTVSAWGSSVPPPPPGLSNVFAISVGNGFLAALVGDGSPRFTIQPVSQTVAKGATVQFHARAVGVQPLSYRWQLDGVDVPGATNGDLTITNAQGRVAGGYRVVAMNMLGAATSATAQLKIPFSTNLPAALNAANLVWTTSTTNAPWFPQIQETHDGDVAAQSGRISHNQQSILQTTTALGPGTLSFWWKVSSEESYDFLRFFANAADFAPITARISGETGWQHYTVFLPMGASGLSWVYSKDATVSAGEDAGWVDEMQFTPASPLTLTAPRLLPDGSFECVSFDSGGRSLLPENMASIEFQASTNLRDWITLTNACTLTNGSLLLRDPDCAHFRQRFYRLIER
ncbi:MAG: hypothetical protein HOP33_16330 [Verrucomicrobia bacterium]|nr:hypothetical protein [Verrucomicrobiota bacterium]